MEPLEDGITRYGLIGTVSGQDGTWQVFRTAKERWPYVVVRQDDGYTDDTLEWNDLKKYGTTFTPEDKVEE